MWGGEEQTKKSKSNSTSSSASSVVRVQKSERYKSPVKPKVKVKVFVFDFFNTSPYGGETLSSQTTKEFRSKLAANDNMIILSPTDIKQLKDKKPSEIDIETTLPLLKSYDVRMFAYGSIEYIKFTRNADSVGVFREENVKIEASISFRFVEISTGKLVYEKILKSTDTRNRTILWKGTQDELYDEGFVMSTISKLYDVVTPDIESLVVRMNWQGRVAKINNNKLYVNAGRRSGVEIGDLLKVIEKGEEIIDPETGQIIGIDRGRVKGTIEIKGFIGEDGAVAEIHTGGGFTVGDVVELY